MGTPDFAVPVLQALVDAGHEIAAAYSQPPRAGGRRGKALTASPVQTRAEELGIAVRYPASLRTPQAQAEFVDFGAEVVVVAAYGLILPRAVLEAPRLGCLNVHGSLLPRWRGAAPVQRAILAGDEETGVGIMQMETGLDTGPVRLEERTPINHKTAGELADELSKMGARLMVQVLADLDSYPPVVQSEAGVTYAAKIDKVETRLDFSKNAEGVERQVRAFNPPGAYLEFSGERFRVLSAVTSSQRELASQVASTGQEPHETPAFAAVTQSGIVLDDALTIACAEGAIRPLLVQRAGRGVMPTSELLRGLTIPPGTRL